ncbi:MAG: ABC transporter permease, partial [Microvirga sp.]
MDLSFVVVQMLTGLASASSLFIIASGLTIVFGVTRIVNFAHGSLYMLGAYFAVTLVPRLLDLSYGPASFWAGILISALAVGLLGVAMEVLLLRRIYRAPELFQLLATFGVVLVVQDLVIRVFGPQDILGPRAPGLRAPVEILGRRFPSYELVLIAAGPVVLGLLWLLLNKTRFGVLVRAATQDREMVGALGVNQALLFTGTLFLGAFLAGLGGALQIPKAPAVAHMDLDIIAETFVVTVIGGMGSIPGAFLAALVIGQLNAFGILVFPKITLVLVFLLMGVVLVLRPYGLLGRPEAPAGAHVAAIGGRLRTWGAAEKAIALATLAVLMLLPLFGDAYALKVATEVMIFGLFAFSLHFLIGTGGLVSFGHAAYFGLGAYGAALALRHLGAPMELALPLAPIAAAAGAALFGFFIVRLSGIYLAMLTLAAAQILYAVAFQWVEVTGGDNGLVGIWPSRWAASRLVYYYL